MWIKYKDKDNDEAVNADNIVRITRLSNIILLDHANGTEFSIVMAGVDEAEYVYHHIIHGLGAGYGSVDVSGFTKDYRKLIAKGYLTTDSIGVVEGGSGYGA